MDKDLKLEGYTENIVPEHLKMYEVSGQDPINTHSFDRYKKDRLRNDEIIQKAVEFIKGEERKPVSQRIREGFANPSLEAQKTSVEMIRLAPESERASLIKEGLSNPDLSPEAQKRLAWNVCYLSKPELASLIKEGLTKYNIDVLKVLVNHIWRFPISEWATLREIVLQRIPKDSVNLNSKEQEILAELIQYAPESERASLIREGLSNSDLSPELQKILIEMIQSVPKLEKTPLIKESLSNPSISPEAQEVVVELIRQVPESERASLIKEVLSNPSFSPEAQKVLARNIWCAPESDRASLREVVAQRIRKHFVNLNPKGEEAVAELIQYAPESERASLIREGLSNPSFSPEAQKALVRMIPDALESERASLIKESLANSNTEVQKQSLRMIQFVPEPEIVSLIKQGLFIQNPEVQSIAAKMIRFAPELEKEKLFASACEKIPAEYIINPPLYDRKEVTKKQFSRTKFDKTGSESILLGGELKDKTIIRRILPEAFYTWQKLYENWELWQQNGFDYVPIEPIQSFELNKKDNLVEVYSGVLDLSLKSWMSMTSRFSDELEAQKQKIKEVLIAQKIEHGHTHDHNFCLRFFRDETTGKPDLTRVPRLYIIDFDMAASSEK